MCFIIRASSKYNYEKSNIAKQSILGDCASLQVTSALTAYKLQVVYWGSIPSHVMHKINVLDNKD